MPRRREEIARISVFARIAGLIEGLMVSWVENGVEYGFRLAMDKRLVVKIAFVQVSFNRLRRAAARPVAQRVRPCS